MGREQKGPIRASFVSSKIFRILWVSDCQIIIIQSSLSFSLKFQFLSQRHIYAEQTTKLSTKQRMRNGGLQFVTKLSGWFEGDFYTIFHCVCQDIREESRRDPGAFRHDHPSLQREIPQVREQMSSNISAEFNGLMWFWMKISSLSIFHLSWHKYSRVFAAYRLF